MDNTFDSYYEAVDIASAIAHEVACKKYSQMIASFEYDVLQELLDSVEET